jgi:hypothetical protein
VSKTNDSEVQRLVDGCRGAIEEEIDAVRADLDRRGLGGPISAIAGTRVSGAGSTRFYDWTLPAGRYGMRIDDAVTIETESGSGLGFVVRFDPSRHVLRTATESSFGPLPGPATLTFDPTWLLAALDGRIAYLGDNPRKFHVGTVLKLFGVEYPGVGEADSAFVASPDLNESQASALSRVVGSDIQFVWGPPGTGKTHVLGHAGAELAASGRVLIVASTNVAVDEAASRIIQILGPGAIEANRIIRFGAGELAGSDPALGLDAAVTRAEGLQPSGLTRVLEEAAERLGTRPVPGETIAIAAHRVLAAAAKSQDPADAAIASRVAAAHQAAGRRALETADVLLCTLARLSVREELATLRFESVLIDEASAVTLPYALFAASLARRRVAVFGDFQQLPAVVQSRGEKARDWMRKDIFRASGVLDSPDGLPSPRDRLCSMLDEQYRMRPAIRSLIGDLFYGGRLRDGLPDPGGEGDLLLVDTAGLQPAVTRAESSRLNDKHIELLLQVLEMLGRQGVSDVAVVAPYRVHVRELRKRVRSQLGRAAPSDLEMATIHRFQGREKQVVIFDTVDAPPDSSWFLDERRNPDFPRMLNVALSRSRDLLILLGTAEGLRRTLPEDALLNRVVDRFLAEGTMVDGRRTRDLHAALSRAPLNIQQV